MQTVREQNQIGHTFSNGSGVKKNGAPHGIRWSVDEYYKMDELGLFQGRRVQLIRGEIIEMAPMGTPHSTAVRLVVSCLRKVFGDGFVIDSQLPLRLGNLDEPEPDVAVIEGDIRDFTDIHPFTARLIVEVADSSLKLDRGRKAELYAENGIEEYWIVNLKQRQLEVFRKPIVDDETANYAEKLIITEEGFVSPPERPNSKLKVRDMLP